MLAKLNAAGQAAVGPYGFAGSNMMTYGGVEPQSASAGRQAIEGGQAYSGTNNHEVGVDEPDLVKTDGHRIVTVANGVLHIVDAANRKQTGTLRLSEPAAYGDSQILLSGDRALIITRSGYAIASDSATAKPFAPQGGVMLTLISLEPKPSVSATYQFDGGYVDARQIGSTARVVVRSAPRVMLPYRQNLTDAQRIKANRQIVAAMSVDDWLPHFTSTAGDVVTKGHVPCETVTHPEQYSGTDMVSVLSFDLSGANLGNGDPITVVADGNTVYASATSLYVASNQRWPTVGRGRAPIRPNGGPPTQTTPRQVIEPATEVYRFDISRPGTPRFVGGGSVPGYLLNQYAMSEWNGSLRVATTASRASSVYVLSIDPGELRLVGHVGGLGHNQQIYAVRFVGAVGYVVTFRQVDPLYVIDLSDPAHPAEKGALELAGYSAYLHPMDDTHLIGIGQDVNAKGRRLGTQVSIFDVTDPSSPKLVAHSSIAESSSQAEYDPHAFLYWPPTGLLVMPVQHYDGTAADAIAFHVTNGSLAKIGRVQQSGGVDRTISRSLVTGSTLWTLSGSDLMASDVTSLRVQAHVTW